MDSILKAPLILTREQIRRKLRIWSHLLKKSLIENFIFCAPYIPIFSP